MTNAQNSKWVKVTLGEILRVKSGEGLTSSQMKNDGEFPVYGGNGINGQYDQYIVDEPSIIIGRVGAKCGVVHITNPKSWVTDNALIVAFDSKKVTRNFLYWTLTIANLNKLSVSTAQPVVSGTKIYAVDILLPPLEEQNHIAEKIEELFSELDYAVATLKATKQQLETYRQSVLKYAFEGCFTGGMKDWKNETLDILSAFITSGSRGWAKYYSETGSIFLRITNLDFDSLSLDLEPSKIQHVKLNGVTEGIRTKVQQDDILISITGYLGMVAIVPANIHSAYVNQHIALVRLKPDVSAQFIGYFISASTGGLKQFNIVGKGATKAGLSLQDIRNLRISLPTVDIQKTVVREIETRLSQSDYLLQTINEQLLHAESLRLSILQKAFSGKL